MVSKQFVFNGDNMNDIVKIAHVPKHSHGRCVVGPFDKILHKGYIWTGNRAVIYFYPPQINIDPFCKLWYKIL